MSIGSDEFPETGVGALHTALIGFTECMAEAIPDICSYGLTIGDSYVPFDPDPDAECDEDAAICSQLWVRVTGVQPSTSASWGGDCAVSLQIGLEVGILRCVEIPEDGEAPTATDVLVGALQATTDMNDIFCAAMGCEVWESISAGSWTPRGPLGGQYGGVWTFVVEK